MGLQKKNEQALQEVRSGLLQVWVCANKYNPPLDVQKNEKTVGKGSVIFLH